MEEHNGSYVVVVIGDLVADYTVKVHKLPINPGDVLEALEAFMTPGGAANFLITASRLGLRVGVVDVVGTDEEGRIILDTLRDEGVVLSGIKVVEGAKTTRVIVIVDKDGRNAFLGIMGVRLNPEVIYEKREVITGSRYLYVSCYSMLTHEELRATLDAVNIAYEENIKIFFDPGPLCDAVPYDSIERVLTKTYIVAPNNVEAMRLTKTNSPEEAARELESFGAKIVVIKMGAEGALLLYDNNMKRIPALNVKVIDTTGAGDSFNAGLLCGLARGLTVEESVVLANVVAAVKVQKLGTGRHMPRKEEVLEHLLALGEEGKSIASKLKWAASSTQILK